MLQSSPPTRSQSANRSRSIESVPMISSPPIKAKKVPDFQKSHDSLSQQLQQRKKDNITTSTRPFNLSMDRLSQSNSALQVLDLPKNWQLIIFKRYSYTSFKNQSIIM